MSRLKRSAASILVILSMAFMVFGCDYISPQNNSSDKERFVGSWKTTIDFTDQINDQVDQSGGDIAEYINIDKFEFTFLFTFNTGGTYTIAFDKESANNSYEDAKSDIKDGILAYYGSMISDTGVYNSVEEMLEAKGISLDGLIDKLMDIIMDYTFGVDIFDDMTDTESGGIWKVEGGKLYTTDDADGNFDGAEALPYKFTSDGIKLSAPEGADEDAKVLFPLILKKVN